MKTIKYFLLALLISGITLSSCRKDEHKDLLNGAGDAQTSNKITRQLVDFGKKLSLKSTASLSLDSATWYLEGYLNYLNANNEHNLNNLSFYKDSVTVFTNGESIPMSTLNQAYEYFTVRLNQIKEAQRDTALQFDLLNLEIAPSRLKSGTTVIQFSASLGSVIPEYPSPTFGPTDYWTWGWKLGKCVTYSGDGVGSDATQQLARRMNAVEVAGTGYFTGVDYRMVMGGDPELYDPDYPGQWYKSMVFGASGDGEDPNQEPCLTPQELNYYLGKFSYIKALKIPQGKTFKNVDISAEMIPASTKWFRMHSYKIYYGTYIVTPDPS